ncbi:type IV pilus modification protein PilV [Candidatus Marimicrobium litorale]|nr:type IV pilus modification protein PilV [Candidatus Marimicrobium litorale]
MPSDLSSTKQSGFTLLEVLIAMIIIATGLLGVASMQLMSFQNSQGAYMRSQATVLATDMLDRMRSNKPGRQSGSYSALTLDEKEDVPEKKTCMILDSGCSAADIASQDVYEWSRHFWNLEDQDGYKPTLPGARATVTQTAGTDEYIVTVFWKQRDWDVDADGNAERGATIENSVQLRTIISD